MPEMSLFLDYLWIWIVLTFAAGMGGYAWYVKDYRIGSLVVAVLAPFLTLALGLSLYYGVDTDRKSITRTLNALIAAVEADDLDAVCRFISPKATDVQQLARTHMQSYGISRVKYHHLEIEINDAASPPIAHVRFSASFYLKTKSLTDGFFAEHPLSVRFDTELVKTRDQSWELTKCTYFLTRNFL